GPGQARRGRGGAGGVAAVGGPPAARGRPLLPRRPVRRAGTRDPGGGPAVEPGARGGGVERRRVRGVAPAGRGGRDPAGGGAEPDGRPGERDGRAVQVARPS